MARDSEGRCLGWSACKFHGSPSLVMAEASAIRHAILMAVERGWSHIQLEGYCIQIINALNDRSGDGLRSFDTIISTFLDLFSRFAISRCSFIRRLSNCLVHALAYILFSDVHVMDGVPPPADMPHLI